MKRSGPRRGKGTENPGGGGGASMGSATEPVPDIVEREAPRAPAPPAPEAEAEAGQPPPLPEPRPLLPWTGDPPWERRRRW